MLFNSLDFLVFFPVAVLGFFLVPKRARTLWLLGCSYWFYMSWSPVYALLILASTLVTWVGGLALGGDRTGAWPEWRRRLLLAAVLAVNLGLLGFFKYASFLLALLADGLSWAGIQLRMPAVDVLLPVGISFYTFQAMGYAIDVYRGDAPAERNLLRYALFVSFFPQLVAGPIERSGRLLGQLARVGEVRFDSRRVYKGLLAMLWGLFLKMVLADRIAVLVNTVFGKYYLYGSVELIAAAVAFAFQIYCHFASYSTIALGAAEVLGIRLTENFDAPYFAGSIRDFWRRWHVSLSNWFRDYLYIPLGGSRRGKVRRYLNLMLTFLLSGLWHGAALTYLVWGGLHGLYQIGEDALAPLRRRAETALKVRTDCFSYRLGRALGTFLLVDLAWVFFRAPSVAVAVDYLRRVFTCFDPWAVADGTLLTLGLDRLELDIALGGLVLLFLSDLVKRRKKRSATELLMEQNGLFQIICVTALVMAILIFGAYGPEFDGQAFIYFQF